MGGSKPRRSPRAPTTPRTPSAHWGWDWKSEELSHGHCKPIHPEPTSFVSKYVFSTDHKVIAKQFLWAGLLFLAFGGMLAMMIRWQWAYPGRAGAGGRAAALPALGRRRSRPPRTTRIFTMHGLIMIFFAITPILIGAFGNFCIPLHDRRAGHGVPAR